MVAALMLYHVAISVMAAVMAWALARLAGLLGLPRRGVWATAIVCSLAAPLALLLPGEAQERPNTTELLPPAVTVQPDAESTTVAPRAEPSPVPAPASTDNAILQSFQAPLRLVKLQLPVIPEWDGVLATLWAILSVGASSVLLMSLLQVRSLLRTLPRERRDGVEMLVSEDFGPAVVGWFRPHIILPRCVIDSQHRPLVLLHEQSHANAHDPLLFGALLLAVAWVPWNPLLWWQLRQLRFAIEVDCDRRVLASGADVYSYGETLLEVARLSRRTALGSTALTEPVSQLGKRVQIMTTELSMLTRVRLAAVSLGVLGASAALAAQVEPPSELRSSVPASELSPREAVSTDPDVIERRDTLRAGLQDAEQRRELQRAQRAEVERLNPDLVAVLGLDPRTGEQLLALLADQLLETQLRSLESQTRFLTERRDTLLRGNPATVMPAPFIASIEQTAFAHSRERGAIRELLGEARFGQYLDYRATLEARSELAKLQNLLPAQQLSTAQREQMVQLLMEEQRLERNRGASFAMVASRPDAQGRWGISGTIPGQPVPPQTTRDMLSNTQHRLKLWLESRERLLAAASRVLNPVQLAALDRVANERIETTRTRIRQLQQELEQHVANGGTQVTERLQWTERQPLTDRIRWSLRIGINDRDAKVSSFATRLGEPVSIELSEGLSIAATPVAYDTRGFMIDMKIYELDNRGAKHLIGTVWDVMSFLTPLDSELAPIEQRQTVLAGSKGYVLAYGARASLE